LYNNDVFLDELANAINIYITSDEEIKVGDYVLDIVTGEVMISKGKMLNNPYVKKIILTTDPTLIRDGVQSIDDNFLEWFVKNPSCEFVEVINEPYEAGNIYQNDWFDYYKIIIPQEEPKQEKEEEYFKHLEKDKKEFAEEWEEIRQEFGFGKKDTLEKAAKNYANEWEEIHPTLDPEDMTPIEVSKIDFIAGAKWQAQRMYSEEEVLDLLYKRDLYLLNRDETKELELPNDWFEQNKKK
jgi:hypothetical protein